MLTGCHLLALISILVCTFSWNIKIFFLVLVTISFLLNYQWHGNARCSRFIGRLICNRDGEWVVMTTDGRERKMQLSGYYWHPLLMVLNFSGTGFSKRSVVILPDSSDSASIRRLRVHLLIHNEDIARSDY
jgi:hypothetical protein